MKCPASIAIATLIHAGVLVGALPVERKSTSSPGTMKGYLQLRGAGENGTHHDAVSASSIQAVGKDTMLRKDTFDTGMIRAIAF